ncbi:MAG: Hsp20/alpha crystallin family protein [Myxococcota bacterium]
MTVNTETALTETATATPAQTVSDPARVRWSQPAVDIVERDDAWVLALDAPGVPGDGFDIRLEDRTLTVSGVRAGGLRGWRRAFTVPTAVDGAGVTAKADNGVLTLTLPKAEAARPRRIAVS